MPVEVVSLWSLLKDGGTLALLVVVLVGGWKQWWVFGWSFKDMKIERDEWRILALKGTSIAHQAVTMASSAATTPAKMP